VTVLHVAGPRFGSGNGEADAGGLQARIWGEVTRLSDQGVARPDLLLVTGDLTENGSLRESNEALTFLTGLRALLGLEPGRLIVVPGAHDVTKAACRAYFASCEADEIEPQPPYWPKWRHFATLFAELYRGLDSVEFDSAQPWTLFAVPELKVVVAGLNSTIGLSHREEDSGGRIGEAQAAWFAERLRPFEELGWLRLGAVGHGLLSGTPETLRDAGTFDRLLAGRLNLVAQGVRGPTTAIGETGGVLCVPAPPPGHHQILEISAGGLRRHGTVTESTRRRWISVSGTFPGTGPGTPALPDVPVPAQPPEEPGPPEEPSPHEELLEQVREAVETRFERAKTRRVPGDPPHLLVTHLEEGFLRQFRVGVHVGRPAERDVGRLLRYVRADGPDVGAELVFRGPPPPRALREDALRRGVRLRSFTEFQGLVDLSSYVERQVRRITTDPLYPPGLYVPQRYRELDRPETGVSDDLVGELLRLLSGDQGRFLLVLGDFGRGKTFALREVARRISRESPHLVPVLIELRNLDKVHTVDGLIAAHLANQGEEQIDLKAFHYMLRQGRIVLLFDGFDELVARLTYERATDHLETLLQAAQDRAKIVVAGRTQHFKSHGQVLTALGERVGMLPQRRVLSIEDFAPAQIRAYLVNRYGDEERADRRMSLLSGIEDLLGLARNPRMLSFIADLDPDRLASIAQARSTVSAADLYREILGSWLAYEEGRFRGPTGKAAGLTVSDLWTAVGTLAMRLWESGEQFLSLTELSEVGETLTGLADGRLSGEQAAHAVGAGSLLVRTEEGLFGFLHSSVVEWLVARHVATEFAGGVTDPAPLGARAFSALTVEFLCDLADARSCALWAAGVLGDSSADDVARANAIRISTRLRTPARTALRGARLQGEDLSYRDLQQVDLTGADLTDAQLVGANLSRATLRGANLTGARLDEARLTGADLREADLSRARLARTDLRDAAVAGSRWTRAALIDVTGPADLATVPELHDAAVAPGRPVDVQLAPAAIGVPYGFHHQTSRLPEPVAYGPDGSTVATGSEDGGVLICDAMTGRPLRTLQGHRNRTYAVVYGPPGGPLVTGSVDGTVRIWDTSTGRCLHTLTVHEEGAWPVLVSPDGTLVAAAGADGIMRVWDPETGELRVCLPGHTAPLYTAVFSPSGEEIVTGDAGGIIRVWNLASGTVRMTLEGHRDPIFRIRFSPDGALLGAGDGEGTVRLWDLATGGVVRELHGHTGRVYALSFHPDGRTLATGDTDGSVRLWDLRTGQTVLILPDQTGVVYQAVFSPDGRVMGTCDSDGVVRLWDPSTGRRLLELTGHRGAVWPLVFRPDGAQLATSSNDGTTRLWDTVTGRCEHLLRGHGRRVMTVGFSPDGSMLAVSGNDGVVRIWEPRTGRLLKGLTGTPDRLTSAVFSPAGNRLATAGNDGGVHLWQSGTWQFERDLNVETDHVWAQAFNPAGDMLATANDDDTVRLWYRSTGRQVANLTDHRGRVRSIDFSPDGSLVATGCDDRIVRLWDAETGRLAAALTGHGDRVYRVVFSPSGQTLASASNDGTARIWDLRGDEPSEAHVLTRHTGRLWTTAFSPDGRLLATGGDDLVVRIWDARTGDHLHTLAGHARRVWAVDFSPDGRLLASGGDDGTVILWDMTGPEPVRKIVLLGLAAGWAALAPDGRYKLEGEVTGAFWNAIAMCRFEPGELDPYLSAVRRLSLDAPF
jgi:WD40 repeat protein